MRLTSYIEENGLLSRFQHGFRKGTGTIDALENIKNIARETDRKYVMVIFIDI